MAIIKVKTGGITADAVTDALIADDVVGTEHLTANEVDTTALGADAVTGAQLADNAVNSEHYTDGSIDTAHIADNQVTLAKLAGGTDGNIISFDASGDPVAIATGSDGQVLTSTGAGSPPAFEALPAGGLPMFRQWRMEANQGSLDTGDHLTNNWAEVDSGWYGGTGGNMSQSSGIFTFPAVGKYFVMLNMQLLTTVEQAYFGGYLTISEDGSNFLLEVQMTSSVADENDNRYSGVSGSAIINVTNTSNIKVRAQVSHQTGQVTAGGSTDRSDTYFTFMQIG